MKYEITDSFRADWHRLTPHERWLFRQSVQAINVAYAGRRDRALPRWPASLRVKTVRGAPGVWELTWSFAGPDGRATFDLIEVGGEPAIRWRRVGGHEIFERP